MTVKLSEIEKAAEGGTEGHWYFERSTGEVWASPGEPTYVARVGWSEDAAFIAASRTAIPALTAALRGVLALLDGPVSRDHSRTRYTAGTEVVSVDSIRRAISAHVDLS